MPWVNDSLPAHSGTVAVITDNDHSPRWMYYRDDTRRFYPQNGIWKRVGCPFRVRPAGNIETPVVIAWHGVPGYP